jgi:hypothetical protein
MQLSKSALQWTRSLIEALAADRLVVQPDSNCAWSFSRAGLLPPRLAGASRIELNFITHLVAFEADRAEEILQRIEHGDLRLLASERADMKSLGAAEGRNVIVEAITNPQEPDVHPGLGERLNRGKIEFRPIGAGSLHHPWAHVRWIELKGAEEMEIGLSQRLVNVTGVNLRVLFTDLAAGKISVVEQFPTRLEEAAGSAALVTGMTFCAHGRVQPAPPPQRGG